MIFLRNCGRRNLYACCMVMVRCDKEIDLMSDVCTGWGCEWNPISATDKKSNRQG